MKQRLWLLAGLSAFLVVWAVVPVLDRPPIWDSAFGVTAAADVLSQANFDPSVLYRQPGFGNLGPNTHGFSLITWVTAVVFKLTPDVTLSHIILHFFQALMGWAALWKLRDLVTSDGGRDFFLILLVGTCPLVMVQMGALYLEIPLLLCVVWGSFCWARGKDRGAALWALLAVLVKITGLILAGAYVITLLTRQGDRRRIWRACAIFSICASVVLVKMNAADPLISDWREVPNLIDIIRHHIWRYVVAVPDLALLMFAVVVGSIVLLRRVLTAEVRMMAAIILSAASFFIMTMALDHVVFWLPRYAVMLMPAVWVVIMTISGTQWRPVACCILIWFVVSLSDETFKAAPGQELSIAERSLESRGLYKVQAQAIRHSLQAAGSDPVLCGIASHYYMSYARNGFSRERPNLIVLQPNSPVVLDTMPDRLIAIQLGEILGGSKVFKIVNQAQRSENWTVQSTSFRDGLYVTTVSILSKSNP